MIWPSSRGLGSKRFSSIMREAPTHTPRAEMTGFVRARRLFVLNLVLFFLYALLGKIGLLLGAGPGYASAIWPPAGVALGMLLLYGYGLWPGVFFGSLFLNAAMSGIFGSIDTLLSVKSVTVVVIAAGVAVQAVCARFLLARFFTFPLVIERPRDAFSFLLISAPVSCLVSATIANVSLYVTGIMPRDQVFYSWLTWWMGDSFGVLAFMPVTIIVASTLWQRSRYGQRILHSLPVTTVFTLMASIAITFVAWRAIVDNIYEKNQGNFLSLAGELEKALVYRIDSYEKSLLSGAGFFAASEDVTRDEWRRYSRWVDIGKNYPGMNGIGFIRAIPAAETDAYAAQQRGSDSPGFDIHPRETSRDERFVITYIEPHDENREAVGYDIASEKSRYYAAVRARDSGQAVITRRIHLVQDKDQGAGFLLLYPLYAWDAPVDTVEQRREAFAGWIYAPFIADKFMSDIVRSPAHEAEINLAVYDGDTVDPRHLIFTSREEDEAAMHARDRQEPMFSLRKILRVKQQMWTVVWQSTPLLEKRLNNNAPLIVLFGGMTFTSLLAMFLIVMSRRTELVQQEVQRKTQEIMASEARLRMLIRHTPAAVAMFDRQMRYIMTSDRWLRDYNLKEADIIGKSHYEVFPELMGMPEWLDHHQRVLRGESLTRDEDAWLRPDGHTEWVRWALHAWRDNDGYIGGIVMFTEVITEQKQARSELMRSNTALEEFAYAVSHDLKAPVRHMGMCAEFLQETYESAFDEEGKKFLKIIVESSAKMRAMIESLLDYARIGSGPAQFRDVDMEAVLDSARANLTAVLRESGTEVVAGRLPTVRGVEGELLRVLQNLIENAVKYRGADEHPLIRIDAVKENNFWKISVADNGIGIDPRFADKVFLLFQRLHGDDSPYTGQGIGLAICQRIVRYHGGEIYLDKTYQGGSRFVFTLPDYAETVSSFDGGGAVAES